MKTIVFLGLLCLFAGSSVRAQVRQIDFTQRNEAIESKRFETSSENPVPSGKWMSRRYNTTSFQTTDHPFASQKFSVEKINLFQSDRFETPELDMGMMETGDFRGSGLLFASSNLERIRFNTLHHSANRESVVADRPAVRFEDLVDQLSLAELNRYQFRRSRAREPGVPVQQAASGAGNR
ncbi:MAG: hypothetical protein AAGJ81_06540 [Verrucomicrobiota bacterium]